MWVFQFLIVTQWKRPYSINTYELRNFTIISDGLKESFLVFALKKYSIHVNLVLKLSLPIHQERG